MLRTEIIYYLEMTSLEQLRPGRPPAHALELRQAQHPIPELNRFLYTAVGGDWWWIDRLDWDCAQWLELLSRPGHETWIAYLDGTPAGYFELEGETGASVEMVSFGLLPAFLGQGFGGWFLTEAVRRAWQKGAKKVWLHTCSFDHPSALTNYKSRGFQLVRTEEHLKEMPDLAPGSWPGARGVERRGVLE